MTTKESDGRKRIDASEERKLVQKADAKAARKAWDACAELAGRVGGGLKALWAKIHPDRSPRAMVEALNQTLDANRKRMDELKPVLEATYAEIVAKKALWQTATEARRRLLKPELETLLARYDGLSREFGVLNENIRSAEAVKSRYLEVLAYEMRGVLDEDRVDELSDLVGDKAEEADGIQDALADLEKAGRRRERPAMSLDEALAEFDGELGLADVPAPEAPAAETAVPVTPGPDGAERDAGEAEG